MRKIYSKGYGDRWKSPHTSALCIWEACLAFHFENAVPPAYEDIKNLNLSFINKKGESELVNPKNIRVEINSYKLFCAQFPDAEELKSLKKIPDNKPVFTVEESKEERLPPERKSYETNKIIRDQGLPKQVKEMYEYKCQVCGVRLEAGNYWYAEAAHIRALGDPHKGNDNLDNILCLCPNHHKLFDIGGFYIEDDLTIPTLNEKLYTHKTHPIDLDAIRYHREWCIESS